MRKCENARASTTKNRCVYLTGYIAKFRFDAHVPWHAIDYSPVSNGNFCSSRFFDILNLELLCRLSFLITGPPGWYLILLISVGGGGALPTGGPPVTLFACGGYKEGTLKIDIGFIDESSGPTLNIATATNLELKKNHFSLQTLWNLLRLSAPLVSL